MCNSATVVLTRCFKLLSFLNNNICQWQVARKTQGSASWRSIISGTRANVVLEKTYNKTEKSIQAKRKQKAKSAKKELKWRTAAMRDSRNNTNDTDNTRNYHV